MRSVRGAAVGVLVVISTMGLRSASYPGVRQAPSPAAILAHLKSFSAYHVFADRLTADTTLVHGDSARQTGTFWQRVRIPAGDTVEVHGRFEADWIKVGPAWRLRRLATAPPK